MSRKRWMWIGGAVLVVLVLAWSAWSMRGQYAYAHIATGYAAKQTCSCLNVSGRTMESCVADFPEDARRNITVSQENATVRASVLFGAVGAEAVYEEGYGCRIVE